jgi:predicted peroxiredoxin
MTEGVTQFTNKNQTKIWDLNYENFRIGERVDIMVKTDNGGNFHSIYDMQKLD